MKCRIYVLYRPKSQYRYSLPFIAESDDAALHALIEIAKTQPEIQSSYLYVIGEYDMKKGKIKIYKKKELVKNDKEISH